MSLESRLLKLEKARKKSSFVVVIAPDGETETEAYQQLFPNGEVNPKNVVYLSTLDLLL
ncbi:MAG: hypothetical protein WAW61_15060 [Methylococcaceae bacterium]